MRESAQTDRKEGAPRIDDDETRAFYQERLALFAKMMFIIDATFFAGTLGAYLLYPEIKPAMSTELLIVGASSIVLLLGFWRFMLKTQRTSLQEILWMDTFLVITTSVVFSLLCFLSYDREVNMWSMFIWTVFMVFGRVLYVPSSAKRTFFLSTAAVSMQFLAGTAVAIWQPDNLSVPGPLWSLGSGFYGAIAVLIATVGSKVIYGLRSQVRAAKKLGQYTLGRKIGEGGMGTVYEAHHALLRRPTAIKILSPEKASADSMRRFELEVQSTAELAHPNTVAIFDYGRSSDGLFYYVMEYLDGLDLETLVAAYGPQDGSRVVHILMQVSGALQEAHSRDLIHRDIKPANILLSELGGVPDVAKIVDFGLVKELAEGTKTTASLAAGTPAYIAPEAVMDHDAVGAASDIYCLGAVAYFLLTGTPVFEAKNAMEMVVHHVRTEPEPVSDRTDNPVSEELSGIIMSCLAKSPKDRPVSAQALREKLRKTPEFSKWQEEPALEWWKALDHELVAKVRDQESAPDSDKALTIGAWTVGS